MTEVAFFDTIAASNSAQFSGTWSSYIYFDSLNIVLSDIGNGLYIVAPDWDAIQNPGPGPDPDPSGCTIVDFDTGGMNAWSKAASSTCSTGSFVSSSPSLVNNGGVTTQLSGAFGGVGSALFTASNSSAGTDDVDQGECVLESPTYPIAVASELSLRYFHGQRDAGDDPGGDYFVLEQSEDNGVTWMSLVNLGDTQQQASWQEATSVIAPSSNVRLRVRVSDGPSAGDLIEAGIDQLSICLMSACFSVDFDAGGMNGWTNSTASTCTTGDFIAGVPTWVTNQGVTTQVAGAFGGSRAALFTANNSSAGMDDVDSGECILESPSYTVVENSQLSLRYFHGQRDTGDDPGGDYFSLEISQDNGMTWSSIVNLGDTQRQASWEQATTAVNAGSQVRLRVRISDGAGSGDLIEAGIDALTICPN